MPSHNAAESTTIKHLRCFMMHIQTGMRGIKPSKPFETLICREGYPYPQQGSGVLPGRGKGMKKFTRGLPGPDTSQRKGLRIWDSSTDTEFTSHPWFAFGTVDTVGMAELNGWVGHHGRNGCRLLCPMPGQHKPGVGVYYSVMLKPNNQDGLVIPPGSSHMDVDINQMSCIHK